MAKLTIEIDMDDSEESWEALYRRIEEFGQEKDDTSSGTPGAPVQKTTPATYDLLLDPDHNFGEVSDFFAVFRSQD
jgi:hypothetical protein